MTVLGNLAIDVIDGAPPSPGGCASFAGVALEYAGGPGEIVAMGAPEDHQLFAGVLDRFGSLVRIIDSDRTAGFRLDYVDVDHRAMSVTALGPIWGAAEIEAADPGTTWVHLAPLMRADFPEDTLALLAARGHRVAYDGQGLVRADQLGPLAVDRTIRTACCATSTSSSWPRTRPSSLPTASSTRPPPNDSGVPEILVTLGSEGCDIYTDGSVVRVPAAWRVTGVQATGAGDMFTSCYVANRAVGAGPVAAAERASELVARELQKRLKVQSPDRV